MTLRIEPFTVDTNYEESRALIETNKEKNKENKDIPITYWRIYLDDDYVSHTSSRELAEETKAWMEKWLEGRL